LLQRGIQLYSDVGQPSLAAAAQVPLAHWVLRLGRFDEADALNKSAQRTLADSNLTGAKIQALFFDGFLSAQRNERALAKAAFYQALEISHSSGPNFYLPVINLNLSVVEYTDGNLTKAVELGRIALELTKRHRLRFKALTNQSIFLSMDYRLQEARVLAVEALPLSQIAGKLNFLDCILAWVLLLASEGHHRAAAQLKGFLLEGRARLGIAPNRIQDRTFERIETILSGSLSGEELAACRDIGATWTEDRAIDFALQSRDGQSLDQGS
jgi:tetratricopeptide (TPR) repeat protein